MATFVFFVNILTATFILTYIAEISTLLIGSLVFAFDCIKNRRKNEH